MHNLLLLSENMFTVEELPSAQKVSLMFWQSKQNIPSGYCCTCKEGANYICDDGLGVFLFKSMHRHREAQMAKSESLTSVFCGIMQAKRKLKNIMLKATSSLSREDKQLHILTICAPQNPATDNLKRAIQIILGRIIKTFHRLGITECKI